MPLSSWTSAMQADFSVQPDEEQRRHWVRIYSNSPFFVFCSSITQSLHGKGTNCIRFCGNFYSWLDNGIHSRLTYIPGSSSSFERQCDVISSHLLRRSPSQKFPSIYGEISMWIHFVVSTLTALINPSETVSRSDFEIERVLDVENFVDLHRGSTCDPRKTISLSVECSLHNDGALQRYCFFLPLFFLIEIKKSLYVWHQLIA